jgi:hypothetical protein
MLNMLNQKRAAVHALEAGVPAVWSKCGFRYENFRAQHGSQPQPRHFRAWPRRGQQTDFKIKLIRDTSIMGKTLALGGFRHK